MLAAGALATDRTAETTGLAATGMTLVTLVITDTTGLATTGMTTLVTLATADTRPAATGVVVVRIDVEGFEIVVDTTSAELDEVARPYPRQVQTDDSRLEACVPEQ